jgi:hypothetical protein
VDCLRREARLEEMLEAAAEADVAGEHGADREDNQRERHRRRRVVQVPTGGMTAVRIGLDARRRMRGLVRGWLLLLGVRRRRGRRPPLPMEREEDEAKHVGRRQKRRQQADGPEDRVSALEALREDLVLAEEPGEPGHTGNRQRTDQERPVGDRQLVFQSAHVAEILFARQRVDHRARSEEQ